jgi:hypothetical protein
MTVLPSTSATVISIVQFKAACCNSKPLTKIKKTPQWQNAVAIELNIYKICHWYSHKRICLFSLKGSLSSFKNYTISYFCSSLKIFAVIVSDVLPILPGYKLAGRVTDEIQQPVE